jgi:hypothetical protein
MKYDALSHLTPDRSEISPIICIDAEEELYRLTANPCSTKKNLLNKSAMI